MTEEQQKLLIKILNSIAYNTCWGKDNHSKIFDQIESLNKLFKEGNKIDD